MHLAAAIGTANCPGAPQLEFKFGRPPPLAPAPDLTVPEPTDSVTAILARFADAGFDAAEAVALLSSHTIAAAVSSFPLSFSFIILTIALQDVIDPVHCFPF